MNLYKKIYLWNIYETEKHWRYQQPNPYNYLGHVVVNNIIEINRLDYLNDQLILISKILNKSYNESIW